MFFNNGNRIALVSDSDKDYICFNNAYSNLDWKLDWYRSDCHMKLADKCDKYKFILIEFRLGSGLLSMEIGKLLIKHGFSGKIFFLASGSMEMYNQRYGSLLMKESVLKDPELVFNVDVDILDQICDTTFITDKVTKGGW